MRHIGHFKDSICLVVVGKRSSLGAGLACTAPGGTCLWGPGGGHPAWRRGGRIQGSQGATCGNSPTSPAILRQVSASCPSCTQSHSPDPHSKPPPPLSP